MERHVTGHLATRWEHQAQMAYPEALKAHISRLLLQELSEVGSLSVGILKILEECLRSPSFFSFSKSWPQSADRSSTLCTS